MTREERLRQIQELVDAAGEISLQSLRRSLPGKSLMTLRRDLDLLEQRGVLIRTHGGAVSLQKVMERINDDFKIREIANIEEKRIIAEKSRKLIMPGSTLCLDAGTTTMCLADFLPDERYTVVTHAPNIALSVMKYNNPTVILLGGLLIRGTLSAAGSATLHQLETIHIDLVFMGATGYKPGVGFSNSNPFECEVKSKIIERSSKVVMLLDSSKIGRQAAFTFATAADVDILITDRQLPSAIKDELAANGAEIF